MASTSPVAKIRRAMKIARKKGYKIVWGDWGVEWSRNRWVSSYGGCCPLGAVLLDKQPKVRRNDIPSHIQAASRALKVSHAWVRGFCAAIDRIRFPKGWMKEADARFKAGYRAGLAFRRKVRGLRNWTTIC